MSHRHFSLRVFAVGLFAAISAAPAHADYFQNGTIYTKDAKGFITQVSDEDYFPYTAGSQFVLTLNDRSGSFVKKGFEVRIFRVGDDGLPEEWNPDGRYDPCKLFASIVGPAVVNDDGSIALPALGANWLTIGPDRKLSETKYILVFESRSNNDTWFRLNENDVHSYFAQGFKFLVRPNGDDHRDEIDQLITAGAKQRQDRLTGALSQKRSAVCYRLDTRQASAPNEAVAALVGC